MRKITWILPTVCIALAFLLSFGSILLFSPALINSNSSKEYDMQTINGTEKTTVWMQDARAHDLLWWQARHGSRPYRYLCLQYLLDAYYAPLSDWSYAHPEIGEEVYRLAMPLYEQEEAAQTGTAYYASGYPSYGERISTGGFRDYSAPWDDFGNIHMRYAAFQYLHIDKQTAVQTYTAFSDSTDDHYYCDRFLKFVTTSEKSAPEDKAWAKAEALRAEALLLAEHEADKAKKAETAAKWESGECPYDCTEYDFDLQWDTNTKYSEQQIEAKCQTLRAIAEEP